jgi:hypothetical protein
MRTPLVAALVTLFAVTTAFAQQAPPPGPQAAQSTRPPTPPAPQNLPNIKLELTITDTYTQTPSTKTVTMLVLAGARGSIRTVNRLPNGPGVQLNMDAHVDLYPSLVPAGRIWLLLTFEYTPVQAGPQPDPRPNPAQLNESLTVVLQDGQKLMISQSADPVTDRKVTVEVTATVLR